MKYQYEILHSTDWQQLEESVERYALAGWRPQGGVSIAPDKHKLIGKQFVPVGHLFAQAMVRETGAEGGRGEAK